MKRMTSYRHPGLGLWSDAKVWLSLLIVPAGLAIGIFLFSQAERKSGSLGIDGNSAHNNAVE